MPCILRKGLVAQVCAALILVENTPAKQVVSIDVAGHRDRRLVQEEFRCSVGCLIGYDWLEHFHLPVLPTLTTCS